MDEALTKHGELILENFERTAPSYRQQIPFHNTAVNPQVRSLLTMIGVASPECMEESTTMSPPNPEEIQLDM